MLIKIYKTLGYMMKNDQDIWVKLWHFSQKLFCINWWNQILNRYHAEFFFSCVTRLKESKTTQYTIDLFSKVWQKIGEVILNKFYFIEINFKIKIIKTQLNTNCERWFLSSLNYFSYLFLSVLYKLQCKRIICRESPMKDNVEGKSKDWIYPLFFSLG